MRRLFHHPAVFGLGLVLFWGGVLWAAHPSGAQTISCTIFPANNVWNTSIQALPTHVLSNAYISQLNGAALDPVYANLTPSPPSPTPGGQLVGMPYVYVNVPGQPTTVATPVPIVFTQYSGISDPGPYPVPTNAPIQGYPQITVTGTPATDQHVLVVDKTACKLYELFHAQPQSDGSWRAGSGALWSLRSNKLRPNGWPSANAAGLPIFPGLVRYEEVASSNPIHHALGVVARADHICTDGALQCTGWIWPARYTDGVSFTYAALPMGSRLRLKSYVQLTPFPGQAAKVVQALTNYGMILTDSYPTPGPTETPVNVLSLSGDPNAGWDLNDRNTLRGITANDFEVVDESCLQVDPDSGETQPCP